METPPPVALTWDNKVHAGLIQSGWLSGLAIGRKGREPNAAPDPPGM
jgi:hypothetical protein